MVGRIPDHFIDDLLSRVDIVEVVDRHVKLRRAGRNYQACCPFHQEKSPSFTVSQEKQFYYCFGCGASGNAVGFLMGHLHLSFVEAVEQLARTAGVEVPREGGDAPKGPDRKPLYDCLDKAARFYQSQLENPRVRERALAYLRKRQLSPEIVKRFGLGFAPPGWDHLTGQFGKDAAGMKLLQQTGMVVQNDRGNLYDRFRDRLMFPIRDPKGRTIAFGGRVFGDEKPKYLNSPETEIFHKGETLYGFHEARLHTQKLDRFVVVEGYMDVIALAQNGISFAVATLGTACTREHVEILFRHVNEVVFCFDGDRAGRAAAWRALENTLPALREGRSVRFHFLPDGEDPDTLVRKDGPELFLAGLGKAKPLPEYLFDHLASNVDMGTLDGRARLAQTALPLIDRVPPGILQELMLQRLSELTRLDREHLRKLPAAMAPPAAMPPPAVMLQPAPQEQGAQRNPMPPTSAPRPLPGDGGSLEPPPWLTEGPISREEPRWKPSPPQEWRRDKDGRGRDGGGKGEAPWKGDGKRRDWQQRPWDRGGGGRGRAPEPPAPPAPVTSLVDATIRSLLFSPQQAGQVQVPEAVRELKLPNIALLLELLEYLAAHPHASLASLLGRWHATEEGEQLAVLAAREFLLAQDHMHDEVADALRRLHLVKVEQELEILIRDKIPDTGRLRELLHLKQELSRVKH
jgi:DNA primase